MPWEVAKWVGGRWKIPGFKLEPAVKGIISIAQLRCQGEKLKATADLRFSAYLGLSSPSGGLCSFVNELTDPNGIEGSKEWAALSMAVRNQEQS